jgi:hypothetical protein
MRTPAICILTAVLATAAGMPSRLAAIRRLQPLTQTTPQTSNAASAPAILTTIIEPGERVGPLKLGDTRARALELFPRKYEDQEWVDNCGTTLYWVDLDNKIRGGSLSIRLKKDKVFQIESGTTRFQTAEGITALDPPEKVASAYKEMRAYTLLTPPSPALGDRPLVFWVDKKRGITFVFAYYPAKQKRYLYKIIVFQPGKTFCPEGESTNSPKWAEIPPYSLEPPTELAPEGE